MKRSLFLIPILLLLLASTSFFALAQQVQPAESPLLTVDSIFTYRTKSLGPVQWQQDGSGYLALEPSATKKEFLEIVRYDALTGERTIKVSVEKLTPQGASAPLRVEEFVLSPDEKRLLVFTNSERVWRSNTRGDYWLIDLGSWSLLKLGGPKAKPSTLMFAKFSPDARRVGYVRENNIYVEDVEFASGIMRASFTEVGKLVYPQITQITQIQKTGGKGTTQGKDPLFLPCLLLLPLLLGSL